MSALMNTYPRSSLTPVRGEGVYLFDDQDKRYLDFTSGIAVNSLGHSHPHLIEIMDQAMKRPLHLSNIFQIPDQERLAERLCALCFADRAFFCNSGAEALEGAFKLARRYHHVNGNPQKYRIITVDSAFHGRTLATLSATGNAKYSEGFGPKVDGFDQVPYGNLNHLRDQISEETAAILIEPIQGEGGLRMADDAYLSALRQTADEFGLLLIMDEVQCGNMRTGKYWAHQWTPITPDILATAKGLGGGLPVGAFMATEAVASAMTPGTHGTTFGGNPFVMAICNAVLDVLTAPDFIAKINATSDYFDQALKAMLSDYSDHFVEIRGRGLMRGLQLADQFESREAVGSLREHGLLCVTAGQNVMRFLPPLILEPAHIDEAMGIIRNWLKTL